MNQNQHWLVFLLKEFTALQEIQKQHFVEFGKINWGPSLKNVFKRKKSNAQHSTRLVWMEILLWLTSLVASFVSWGMKYINYVKKNTSNPLSGKDVNDCPSVHLLGGNKSQPPAPQNTTIISVFGLSKRFGLSLDPQSSGKLRGNSCLHFSGPSFLPLCRYPGD